MATKSESIRNFTTVANGNGIENDTDSRYQTKEGMLTYMRDFADEFFGDNMNETIIQICLIDFDNNQSTIYQYTVKREYTVECMVF